MVKVEQQVTEEPGPPWTPDQPPKPHATLAHCSGQAGCDSKGARQRLGVLSSLFKDKHSTHPPLSHKEDDGT